MLEIIMPDKCLLNRNESGILGMKTKKQSSKKQMCRQVRVSAKIF